MGKVIRQNYKGQWKTEKIIKKTNEINYTPSEKDWFDIFFKECLRISVENKRASKNDKGVIVSAQILSNLSEFKVKKVFFAENNQVPHMYFLLENGNCFELPVHPTCPITLITKEGLKEDLNEFKKNSLKKINNDIRQLDEIIKEI